MVEFEWNEDKAIANIIKHKISFSEATTVFDDPYALYYKDSFHSFKEDRYIVLGYSNSNRMLIVSFTNRMNKTRIISARLTTKKEKKQYGK